MLGRLFEQRAVTDLGGFVEFDRGPNDLFSGSTAGQRVTHETARSLLAVSGAVGLIANSIASLPVKIMSQGELVEQPPLWATKEMSPGVTPTEAVTACVMSLLLHGNLYVAPIRDQASRVQYVYVLDPTRMDMRSRGNDPQILMDGRPVTYECYAVRGLVAPGSVKGLDPIRYARQLIGIGLGAQEQAAKFYAQGTITPGVIETEGFPTKEQMRETRDQWVKSHGGSRNSHLPVVLANGKFKQISMSWEQAQFLETRKYTDAQIVGQIFYLDPSMLGIPVEGNSLTYQTLETRNIDFVRRTLLPWITRLEGLFSMLLPARQQWKFNVDGILRADLNTRYNSYKTAAEIQQAVGEPLLTVAEMRELENRPPIEVSDET